MSPRKSGKPKSSPNGNLGQSQSSPTPTKPPAKMGRPTKYNPDLATRFCEEIVRGASVNELCAREEFPSDCTIYRWFHENEDFREKYLRARELQADFLADEVIPVANG